MKACGIITEYNPFHNGHIYHIQQARQLSGCDVLVAVMSGNFVQRGEPAIIDKWQRTKTALDNGVDLVIELPFAFVCQSATQFGENAVNILTGRRLFLRKMMCLSSQRKNRPTNYWKRMSGLRFE